ncbi:hypothetical protein BV22DRAFT_449177 [Leucogyrophana mollusca]|uniref:Uncharacterized protein n=1 Tax=Leucogyrophana mollusca TaxID=85980 RepID=A0ACB8BL14_9AGAM|nr:hypothetical protein BV22DRAFT_449177 [Leucogyrophana mollusca]
MAGFLRKKATIDKKNAGVGAKQAQPQPPPPKVAELPPSLPPLFARFATKNTLEPGSPFDPWSSKISLPTSLGKLSQEPDLSLTSADQTSDGWNEWRVYSAQNTFNGMVVPDQTPVEPRSHGTAGLSNYSTGTTAPHPRQKPAIPAPAPSNHPLHSFQEKPTHTGPGSTLAPSTDVSSKPPHSTSVRPSVVSSRSPVLEVSSRQAREESPSHPIVPSKTLSSRTVQPVVPSAKPSVPVYRSLPSNPAARLPKAAATVPESPGSTFSTSTLTASHVPSFSSAATRHQLPSPPTSQDLAHTHTPRSPEKNHGASPAQNITRQVQPGTYSSLGSSTTHTNSTYTDATRRTSTFVTAHSASSIPATKQIDVINLDGQARPSSATRPAHSHPPSSTPRSPTFLRTLPSVVLSLPVPNAPV